MENAEIYKERNEAWVEWSDWENEEFYPRFYKRQSKHINPWNSMNELREALDRKRQLYKKYIDLHFRCTAQKIPGLPDELLYNWREEQTSDGKRMRRIR